MIKIFTPKQLEKYCATYTPDTFQLSASKLGVFHLELAATKPLYTHSQEVIEEVLENITFPRIKELNVNILNLPYNIPGFCNGMCWSSYRDGKIPGAIALLGRTTSIPHSMTRYALSHELGHAVHNELCGKQHGEGKDFKWKEYLAIRGLNKRYKYPLPHHKSPAEIFANDFRLLFSPYDSDFWPHEVIRPEKVKGLKKFMLDLAKKKGN